ncbi:PucR family transcriptional regulator [Gulosibacter molinativorax]|nr:PucR family transcriptional regulator [Gulosibacter molinativorax]QUY63877.1 Hypotetical protein [Gulosibacter molinativorax]
MLISDLLAEPSLQLRLETPSSKKRLSREVARCAPAEYLDPTPYLEPNALVLTSGIGMNFTEPLIWDAYVERLKRVPISALVFAVGIAHQTLPAGLIDACARYDVPLIEAPNEVPLFKVNQYVEYMLQTERIELTDRGWQLADECARLANNGAEISTLLAAIYAVLEVPVAVYDAHDLLIAKYPSSATWQTGIDHNGKSQAFLMALPMGLNKPCQLAVQRHRSPHEFEALLAPVSSILALQLNRAARVDASSHTDMLRFLNRSTSWSDSTRSEVASAFQELGLNRTAETSLLVADLGGKNAASVWKLRVALHDAFYEVRVIEVEDRLIALMQIPRHDLPTDTEHLLQVDPNLPLVFRGPTHTIDELRIALVHALDLIGHTEGPVIAPALGLSAVVAAAAGRGARESAKKFLQPLIEQDEQRSTELLPTLRTWLRHDAQPSRTCEQLFIHRNSLSYRLHRIEEILGIPLDTLDGKATCLMALRLVELEPY